MREMPSQPSAEKTVVAYRWARARISAGRSCGSSTRSAPAMPSLDPMLFRPCLRYFSAKVSGDVWLVTGISVTEATGSSSPATATLISSRFLMNGSMIASTSVLEHLEDAGDEFVGSGRDRHSRARTEVTGLHDDRPAERLGDTLRIVDQPCRAALQHRALARQPLHDRHAVVRRDDLRGALVHADRRGHHTTPDVGAPSEFERALNAAVLAVSAVQHRHEHIDGNRATAGGSNARKPPSCSRQERSHIHRYHPRCAEPRRQRHFDQPRSIGAAALERVRVPEVVADPPPRRLIDVNRHRREAFRIDRVQDLQSADDGHVVLEGAPPEHHRHGLTQHRRHGVAHDAAPLFRAGQKQARASLVEVRKIVLQNDDIAIVQVLVQPAEGVGAVGQHDEPLLAPGVTMPFEKCRPVRLGDDHGVVADGGGFTRELPVDLVLSGTELNHTWRNQEAAGRWKVRCHLEGGAEPELVRVVGVPDPGHSRILDHLEPVGHRLQRSE